MIDLEAIEPFRAFFAHRFVENGSLGAYRESFKNGGVLVLDPKSEFLRYFDGSKSELKP